MVKLNRSSEWMEKEAMKRELRTEPVSSSSRERGGPVSGGLGLRGRRDECASFVR